MISEVPIAHPYNAMGIPNKSVPVRFFSCKVWGIGRDACRVDSVSVTFLCFEEWESVPACRYFSSTVFRNFGV